MAKKKSTKRKENHYGNPANYGKKKEDNFDVPSINPTNGLKDWNILCFPGLALGLISSPNYILVAIALALNITVLVQYFKNMKSGTVLAVTGILFAIKNAYNCFKNGTGTTFDWKVTIGYIISSLIVSAVTMAILELFYMIKRRRQSKKVG